MKENIRLGPAKFPLRFNELMESNQLLKFYALLMSLIAMSAITMSMVIGMRPPVVLPLLANTAEKIETGDIPKPGDEVAAAVRHYLDLRYTWDAKTVRSHLDSAKAFIQTGTMKVYQEAMENVARFSTEKAVSQRVYANRIAVDLDKRLIAISGDRITEIQGIKAAGSLKIELQYESGPRTRENPWGIYIAKEREEL